MQMNIKIIRKYAWAIYSMVFLGVRPLCVSALK